MNNCKYCKADCALRGEENLKECNGHIHMTNADRIRSMTDEELSEFINALTVCDCCSYNGICSEYNNIPKCRKGVLEWLQQPTEGG